MFGVTAWLTISINASEWRRRERYGLGALTGLEHHVNNAGIRQTGIIV